MNKGKKIYETIQENPDLRTFFQAIEKTHLSSLLKNEDLYTVFAPNDNAYAKIPQSTLSELLKEPVKLKDLSSYHLIPGKILYKKLTGPIVAQSVQGENLSLNPDKFYTVNNVRILVPDIECLNGAVHVIYKVLDPYERV